MLFHFSNLDYIFNILLKNMTIIVDVFPKLRTLKNMNEQIQVPFDGTLREATCKGDQTVLKSELHHLYHIY